MTTLNIPAVYQLIALLAICAGSLFGFLFWVKVKNDNAIKKAEKDWENDPLKNR
jgi:hypothetical protein